MIVEMGWIRQKPKKSSPAAHSGSPAVPSPSTAGEKTAAEDREQATSTPDPALSTVPDSELRFISPADVAQSAAGSKILWIVIDSIVYDCTSFASEHPGGADVLDSFRGADCSWQFWRFHGPEEMAEYGRVLRIGRTQGMVNKYQEPPRFVGLRSLSAAFEDW